MAEARFVQGAQGGDAIGIGEGDFGRGGDLAFGDAGAGGGHALYGGGLVFEGEREVAGVDADAQMGRERGARRGGVTIQGGGGGGEAGMREGIFPEIRDIPGGFEQAPGFGFEGEDDGAAGVAFCARRRRRPAAEIFRDFYRYFRAVAERTVGAGDGRDGDQRFVRQGEGDGNQPHGVVEAGCVAPVGEVGIAFDHRGLEGAQGEAVEGVGVGAGGVEALAQGR